MGIIKDGEIKVGLVWCEWKRDCSTISMCLAVEDSKFITPGIMRDVFSYAFDDLGCRRITNSCSINNRKAIAVNLRSGFKQEGVIRHGYTDGSDMVIFGLLKDECKYIK
jgi:hypothetical protein